jgi:hypothetical protein
MLSQNCLDAGRRIEGENVEQFLYLIIWCAVEIVIDSGSRGLAAV